MGARAPHFLSVMGAEHLHFLTGNFNGVVTVVEPVPVNEKKALSPYNIKYFEAQWHPVLNMASHVACQQRLGVNKC